jgi:hypothetical protein
MNEGVHDWASFWDQPHSIYVNQRHCEALLLGLEAPLCRGQGISLDHGYGHGFNAILSRVVVAVSRRPGAV